MSEQELEEMREEIKGETEKRYFFILSPIYSLFDLDFYRQMRQRSPGRGFGYLAYLSFWLTILLMVAASKNLIPPAGEFLGWLKREMPVVNFNAEGVSANQDQLFVMEYPAFNLSIAFDTSKTSVNDQELGDHSVFITKEKIYLRQRPNETRIYEILPRDLEERRKIRGDFVITGDTITRLSRFLIAAIPFIFLIFYLFYLIWKLTVALLYSVIALFFNLFRKNRLRFGALWNTSALALTFGTIFQGIQWLFPAIQFRFQGIAFFVITCLYLGLAIKWQDRPESTTN